ncbi:hypothetical protein CAEBREN_16680 [Caenorhabditis brenneri]|uniref:Uncharacterized protein n=1 Tax=Caenorhabditis brenneri TaxID=135651 RepID=G0P1C4_CAEBE|nr:hypothetical protein CAEBREN_16680 [Caenorhabditis brenneri]
MQEHHKEYNIHKKRYLVENSKDYFQISCYVDENENDLVLKIKRVRVSITAKDTEKCPISFKPTATPIEHAFCMNRFMNNLWRKRTNILFKTPTFEFCSLSAYSEEPFPPEGYETEEDNELDDLEYSIEKVMKHHAAYDDSNKQYRISKDHYFQISIERKNDSLRFNIEKKKSN